MIPIEHFYMIRHGQTEANASHLMAGSMDSPLTETGREQAYQAQKIVAQLEIKPTKIYHSQLSRARDTAQIINDSLNVEMIETSDLAEICTGEWEGKPWEECADILNGWIQAPGGECPNDFFERVKQGKRLALQEEGPVLIVCHGGVMRAFGALYGLDVPGIFKNAHLYEFIPGIQQGPFPWDVYDYELCDDTKVLKRKASSAYLPPAEEIAS